VVLAAGVAPEQARVGDRELVGHGRLNDFEYLVPAIVEGAVADGDRELGVGAAAEFP